MMEKKESFKKINVLIVEDSLVCAEIIKHILESDSEIVVAGIARDGKEAIQKVAELKPDIITMDIHMPHMNGLEATEYIMAYQPTPIIVVSSTIKGIDTELAFRAISAGALDALEKPDPAIWESFAEVGNELISKVKLLSRVKTITHIKGRRKERHRQEPVEKAQETVGREFKKTFYRPLIVAIGASTGGPQAIAAVLGSLSEDFPIPIVIAQHIAEGFLGGLISWLRSVTGLDIVEAQDMQEIVSGRVYICPTKYNAVVVEPGVIELIPPEKENYYCPSIDLLLSSVVDVFGMHTIGVLLTGMGEDGARGLKKIFDQGGHTFAQDKSSSVIYGMPKAAIKIGAVKEALPAQSIGKRIKEIVDGVTRTERLKTNN